MNPCQSSLCNGSVCVFVFVIRPDPASQTLRDPGLFMLLFDCKFPLGFCKQFDPGVTEVVGQVMGSSETDKTHREVCAKLLSPQDVTSR